MSQTRVNYDAVALSYDRRTEQGFLPGIAAALQNLARQVQAQRVLDLARFPSLAEQEAMLNQAGFRHINRQVVEQFDDKIVGEAIFDFYFLSKNSTSQLILLSAEAYQAGLARMRAAMTEAKTRGEEGVGFRPGQQVNQGAIAGPGFV